MTTALEIIEPAYARSTANDAGKLTTDTELLGELHRVFQLYFAIAASAQPDSYLARSTVTLAAGVGTLPTDVIDVSRVQTSGGGKVNVIPITEIDRSWHFPPCVFRQGRSIVSRGNPGDPGPSDALTLWLLDAPAPITALSSTIDVRFPVRNHQLLVLDLAMYLSGKDDGRDPGEYAELKDERNTVFQAFLRLSGLSLTALQATHTNATLERIQAFLGGGK